MILLRLFPEYCSREMKQQLLLGLHVAGPANARAGRSAGAGAAQRYPHLSDQPAIVCMVGQPADYERVRCPFRTMTCMDSTIVRNTRIAARCFQTHSDISLKPIDPLQFTLYKPSTALTGLN